QRLLPPGRFLGRPAQQRQFEDVGFDRIQKAPPDRGQRIGGRAGNPAVGTEDKHRARPYLTAAWSRALWRASWNRRLTEVRVNRPARLTSPTWTRGSGMPRAS